MKFCRLWNSLTGNILEAPSLSHFKLDQTNDLKICCERRGCRGRMNEFFLFPLWKLPPWCQHSVTRTHTHTRTHVQAHTVTYFHIVSFLTSQFHHHQNSILKPQKPLSVARSTFAIYSDPTFPSLWIRFAVQAIKSLHVPLCHL